MRRSRFSKGWITKAKNSLRYILRTTRQLLAKSVLVLAWPLQLVLGQVRAASTALKTPGLQVALFAILAAMVGILFTVRATYVFSFRTFDMEAVGYLLSSEHDSSSAAVQRLLACLNLVASEDSRNAESVFTFVTFLFGISTAIVGFQAVVTLVLTHAQSAPKSLELMFPRIIPHTTTALAIILPMVGVILMSGWLFGTRVIDLPESKEGVQFFAIENYRGGPKSRFRSTVTLNLWR